MRVISQDGILDVPYERFCFEIAEEDNCCGYSIIAYETTQDGCYITMASFASCCIEDNNDVDFEKALKVMEMLRDAYIRGLKVFEIAAVSV